MSLCIVDCLVCRFGWDSCMGLSKTCTPNSHLYTVTYTRCCIDTINSPDDGHMAAWNMYRLEINIHEKEVCVKLVIYKDYTRCTVNRTQKIVNISSLCFCGQPDDDYHYLSKDAAGLVCEIKLFFDWVYCISCHNVNTTRMNQLKIACWVHLSHYWCLIYCKIKLMLLSYGRGEEFYKFPGQWREQTFQFWKTWNPKDHLKRKSSD
jgi:hypothetical protein